MTQKNLGEEMIFAAARLQSQAPDAWQMFMATFGEYVGKTRDELVAANPSVVLTAQGRAKYATELFELFNDCANRSREIEAKRRVK